MEKEVSTVLQTLHTRPVRGRASSGHEGFKCLGEAQEDAGQEENRKGSASCPWMLDMTVLLTLANPGNPKHLEKKTQFCILWSSGHILKNRRLAGFGVFLPKWKIQTIHISPCGFFCFHQSCLSFTKEM